MTKGQSGKKVIVLIEDDQILVDLLAKKLEKAGYAVKTAEDGIAGLDLVRQEKPELALLDMMLPKLNGFGVLEKMAEEKILPDLPVVIISNSGQPIEIERAKKLGVRDFLIKVNFDPNEVLDIVNLILKPESAVNSPEQQEKKIADPPKNAVASVLIVEDDNFLVDLLEKKFRKQNYKTLRANDARQARSILENNAVDIILLDVVLPGTDGFTFLAEIKSNAKLKNIPVIIISNLGQREERERGLRAGAVDYIIKAHVSPGDIVVRVDEVLKKVRG